MQIQESGEMYLETIYILSLKGNPVRSIDVSDYMGFSKPSVSRAVGLLKEGGYLETNSDGALILTAEGHKLATKTYERHRVLTEIFMRLGVPKKIASADACKIEHDISDETFAALRKYMNI